jgi:hypothetical protein
MTVGDSDLSYKLVYMLESYGLVMGVLVLMTVARFYSDNGEPLDGAILFAVMVFFARLYHSHSWLEIGLFTAFSFVYCYFYFSLLCRFRDRIAPWVLILFTGGTLWAVVPFYILFM